MLSVELGEWAWMSLRIINIESYEAYLQEVYAHDDGCIVEPNEIGGLKVGQEIAGATILGLFSHPESECYWCVIRKPDGSLYEMELYL